MMHRRPWRSLFFAVVMAACLIVPILAQAPAYAQTTTPATTSTGTPATPGTMKTVNATGITIACDTVKEAQGGALIGKIVPCMTYTIQQATIKFAAQMVTRLQPLLYAFLTLVIVLFGARMMMQEPEIYKRGFVLLLKISLIAIVLNDLGNVAAFDGSGGQGKIIPAVYATMEDAQTIVTGAIDTTNLKCDIAHYQGPNTPTVWAIMDCVAGRIFGYTTGTDPSTGQKTTNMLLVSSFFGLATGFFFGGAWGVVVFLGMVGTLFAVFMTVVRTAVTFISSYLVICLLLILSPLLLPLAFLKQTESYFDNTWRIMLASFFTPILITAYAMFSLIVYDKMLFSDTSIVQTLLKQENLTDAVRADRQLFSLAITGNPYEMRFDTPPTAADLLDRFSSPMLQHDANPTLNGSNDPGANFSIPTVLKDKIKGLTQSQKDGFEKLVFQELLELFIMAYLINSGMSVVQTIIPQILGKSAAVKATDRMLDNNLNFQQGGKNAFINAKQAFLTDKPNTYKSGNAFLSGASRDIPNAFKKGTNAFFDGLKNKP